MSPGRFIFFGSIAVGVAIAIGCGDSGDPASPSGANAAPVDASSTPTNLDASTSLDVDASDAGTRVELATGTHLVKHAALLAGVTVDGFVAFTDVGADGGTVAKVVSLDDDAGAETTIATSTGTGKSDLRYEIHGRVVFVWSDRGNREASLTMWSAASGVVPIGPHVRPGRAAATADGKFVLYVRDVTDAGAKIVAGSIDAGSSTTTIGMLNAADDDCWQDVDLANNGAHLYVRFCPDTSTSFALKGFDPATNATTDIADDVGSAVYGGSRLVWAETSGALKSSQIDGTEIATLATGTAEYTLSADESLVAFRNRDGGINGAAIDGGNPRALLPSGAVGLGAVSTHGEALLFATQQSDAGATDVKALRPSDGGVSTIVKTPTACLDCLFDSFTTDGTQALVLNPVSATQDGPVRIVNVASGKLVTTYGTQIATAAAFGDGGTRFVFLDATADSTLANGAYFGVTTRNPSATDDAKNVAKGAENVEIELNRNVAVFSFPGPSANAGIWVAPLP